MSTLLPGIVEIRTEDKRHEKIIKAFKSRLQMSETAHQRKRQEKWKEAEDTFLM